MNKRRRTGPRIESATDRQKVEALSALYAAYHTENTEEIKQLELWQLTLLKSKPTGGEEKKLRVFSLLDGMLGSRSLEIHWHGIVNGPFLFRRPITFDLSDLRQLILWFLLDIELHFSYIRFAPKRVPIKRYELT